MYNLQSKLFVMEKNKEMGPIDKKKNQTIEVDLEMVQMLDLGDTSFKSRYYTYVQGLKRKHGVTE